MPTNSKTISVNGRQYKLSEFLPEMTSLADMLAKNAHLTPETALPPDTDFSDVDHQEVYAQIGALGVLPREALDIFSSVFAAAHLPNLAAALRRLSAVTQPRAMTATMHIFSLIPDPKHQPYLRKFLRNTDASKGLGNIIADGLIRGLTWGAPAGFDAHCTLIIHTLFWCDPTGDDGKASIDAEIRDKLAKVLDDILAREDVQAIPRVKRVDIERLRGLLDPVEAMPAAHFLDSTRQHLEGQVDMCAGDSLERMCDEEPALVCSRCKVVKYCGAACQNWHWKHGHKAHCHPTNY
ncbi:MYND-type domain-containing protein [Mycena indigotica]|uniref:MYND-type domain-containing protein n=1 Tax=Mycena indigotica TaxID=2126181 RepID=A0A8H6S107_9AGAR|nr:MYND-type domain-containing protein [Mycena indigotica]KAF7290706.1 MYND-type domain-containing protein [Mycena indigotica]